MRTQSDFLKEFGDLRGRKILTDEKGEEFLASEKEFCKTDDSLSNEDYLELVKANDGVSDGSEIEDLAERKSYIDSLTDEQKANKIEKERIIIFRGSDESVDRMGDIIRVDGWNLKDYRKNPVFLDGHSYTLLPIGKALKVWKDSNDSGAPNGKSLKFAIYFPTAEVSQKSDDVFKLYKAKVLNAVSVGFKSSKVNNPSSPEERKELGLGPYGWEFLKQSLLELSAVTVPANQNALQVKSAEHLELCKSAGIEAILKENQEEAVNAEILEQLKLLNQNVIQNTKTLQESISLIKSVEDPVEPVEAGEEPNGDNVKDEAKGNFNLDEMLGGIKSWDLKPNKEET